MMTKELFVAIHVLLLIACIVVLVCLWSKHEIGCQVSHMSKRHNHFVTVVEKENIINLI